MYIDQFCILGGTLTSWSNKERTNRQFSKCSETLSNHSLQWTLATNAIMMLVHCQVYHRVRRFFRKETLLRPFESPKLIPNATKKGLTLVHRIMYSPSTRAWWVKNLCFFAGYVYRRHLDTLYRDLAVVGAVLRMLQIMSTYRTLLLIRYNLNQWAP